MRIGAPASRLAVITGGSRGFDRAIALPLAQGGVATVL
jgi:NAD(P)-dependent dehydrogenase (short-subunit alcohol dehydrogenase family)